MIVRICFSLLKSITGLLLLDNMKFDVIIGNPPYQMSDGGGGQGASASPIYHCFIQSSIKLKHKYLVMIIPSKWFIGGKVPKDVRLKMLDDKHLKEIHDFVNSSDCFQGVELAGGVNYFLRDVNYNGKCHIYTIYNKDKVVESTHYLREDKGLKVFIRHTEGVGILKKVRNNDNGDRFNKIVSERNPFNFATSFRGKEKGDIKIYHSEGEGYVSNSDISSNKNCVKQHKVFVSYANGNAIKKEPYSVISEPFYGEIDSICTDTYLMVGIDTKTGKNYIDSKSKVSNLISYMKTRFFRFLLCLQKITPTAASDSYSFIPLQDFSKPWTDEELYKKYGLTQEEIDFIESMIKPME